MDGGKAGRSQLDPKQWTVTNQEGAWDLGLGVWKAGGPMKQDDSIRGSVHGVMAVQWCVEDDGDAVVSVHRGSRT